MKTALVLVGYGPASLEGRECLRGFEALCRARFPGMPIRWAFTSARARNRMAAMRQKSDSLLKALLRLRHERFDAAAIQPLQTIPGREFGEVAASVAEAEASSGLACALGEPIMRDNRDIDRALGALLDHAGECRGPGAGILFMAHGAVHPAGALYEELASAAATRCPGIHLAAMSGRPTLEETLPRLPGAVWLLPLLSSIGSHALRDMAGPGPASWKSRIEASGRVCMTALKGMTQSRGFAQIWLDNLAAAAASLENGGSRPGHPPAPSTPDTSKESAQCED